MSGSVLARGLLALLDGLALFLADYPVSQPWLVLLAFAPLLWVAVAARSRREAGAYGILWGLGRTVPLAYMLGSFGLPVPARFAVEAYLLGLDSVFALVAFELRARRAWPLLVAITFASIEYADSLLPMWGTARSVARLIRFRRCMGVNAIRRSGAPCSVHAARRMNRGQREVMFASVASQGLPKERRP